MAARKGGDRLGAAEHRSRERILTQADPAKVRRSATAVVLKEGSLMLLTDEGGDVPSSLPHGFGLFLDDCRFLDAFELTLNGEPPTVLSGTGMRGFETRHRLTNETLGDGENGISKHTIALQRRRLIRAGVVHELQSLHNYGRRAAALRVELRYRARFEDVFVVKGFVRRPRGRLRPPRVVNGDRVELTYEGADGVVRTTALVFSPAPDRLDGASATYVLSLPSGADAELAITLTPSQGPTEAPPRPSAHPQTSAAAVTRWLERSEAIWLARSATVRGSSPLFERVFRRALLDLRQLRSRLDGYDYFAAGIPWFATLFGRDAAVVALQTLPYGLQMAQQTLRLLARYQATRVDAYRDAAPGKILHEYRAGELARARAIPQSPAYYGSVDATPLFLILLTEYVRWSADLALARELRPNVDAALGWLAGSADSDGDGYLDYAGRYATGLINQGWKDSGNAIVNADGSLPEPPIALCEVQAYAYRAWRQTGELLRRLGDDAAAVDVERRADDMRARFARDFWDPALGAYVLARQHGGRPAAVVSSNAGHVLWGCLAEDEHAARVADRLMQPDMFSGWGIRTLSSRAVAYNPMSYHLGSVWPHDNALIAAGFRRYGHDEPALRVFDAVFDAATRFRHYRLPELFAGYPRTESEQEPVRYPVACSPQAWAAGALPYALWNLLGLRADAPGGLLRVLRPRLPEWLEWVELTDVKVGSARVDLRFQRVTGGAIDLKASVQAGTLRIEHDPHATEWE
jgi:glycogen debranching enzyme